MLVVLVVAALAIAVASAVRIVLGWVLTRPALARLDRLTGKAARLYVQACVVGLAGLFIFALWDGQHEADLSIETEAAPVASPAEPPWHLPDPDQEHAKADLNLAFARKLMNARTLADVQKLAGSKGKITERQTGQVGFHWIGNDSKGLRGFMLLEYFKEGSFGASISPSDVSGTITVNSFGNLICDHCKPPINVCGRRPSWVPEGQAWCD